MDSIAVTSAFFGMLFGRVNYPLMEASEAKSAREVILKIIMVYTGLLGWKKYSKIVIKKMIQGNTKLVEGRYEYLMSVCVYFGMGWICNDFVFRIYGFL